MAWPTIAVEIDLVSEPWRANASNVWTDITDDVLRLTIVRGRQDELSRVEAGRATITLDNATRLYNPLTNPNAPSTSGIQPFRKVRISATYDGDTYRLYTGYVESWPPEYSRAIDAEITVTCIDVMKYFSLYKLNLSYSSEYTNWAIDTALTAISWSGVDRNLHSGQSQIQAGTLVNVPLLSHVRSIEEVESGLFFIDGLGRPSFHGRHYRLTATASTTVQDILTDELGASRPLYMSFTSSYDDTYIWNQARITRTGGTEQVANDYDSQDFFLLRSYVKTLPMLTDAEALALAEWFVLRYGQPYFRFTSVTLDGAMDDENWGPILELEISDRVTVESRVIDPTGTAFANVISQDCFIEGVAHSVDPDAGRWTATFQLSPVDSLTYWILQDATYGVLDSTTILAY